MGLRLKYVYGFMYSLHSIPSGMTTAQIYVFANSLHTFLAHAAYGAIPAQCS